MQVLVGGHKRLYGALILLSILTSVWITLVRLQAETENRRVGLMVDFYATRQLANESGRPLADVLGSMRARGVWGVGLEELTVAQAAREGRLMLLDGSEVGPVLQAFQLGWLPANEASVYVIWWPATTQQWLGRALRLHLEPWAHEIANARGLVVWEIPARPPTMGHAGLPVSAAGVAQLGLGLSESAAAAVRQAGLAVVPRFLHCPTLTEEQVRFRLAQIGSPAYDSVPVVFSGSRVPGYPDLGAQWATGLRTRRLPIGLIEFTSRPGDEVLAKELGYEGIRLHAITPAELSNMDPDVAVKRWSRAVRERNVRLLYVRPLPWENAVIAKEVGKEAQAAGDILIEKNLEYLESISAALRGEGYVLGQPAPFRHLDYPSTLLLVLAAGVTAGSWLLFDRLLRVPAWLGPLFLVGGTLLFGMAWATGSLALVRRLYALAGAIAFPTLGVLMAGDVADGSSGPVKGYWIATGVSLVGALHVVGLLGHVSYMLRVEQFMGVKLAHLAPPVLMFLAMVLGPLPFVPEKGPDGWDRVRRFFSAQVPVRFLAMGAVVCLFGLLYILRTGNDALPVISAEQSVRQFLESLLVVRPRTKEFLVGHPLLVAALDQKARGRSGLAGWLMVGAVVGQLSMVNTFSHIHTSLWVSAWRTGLGLLVGLGLGWFVARPVLEWAVRHFVGQEEIGA